MASSVFYIFPYLLISILFVPPFVSAASIGISPSHLSIELYRGETSQAQIVLINPSDKEVRYSLEVERYPDWFTLPEPEGLLLPGETKQLSIGVAPPLDVPNGEYSTLLMVSFEEAAHSQLSLGLATAIKTSITVSGSQKISLFLDEISARDIEQGLPLVIEASLTNQGNVRSVPVASISIRKNGKFMGSQTLVLDEIFPDSSKTCLINISTQELDPGNYSAHIILMLNHKEFSNNLIEFGILPYGATTRAGVMDNLTMKEEPLVGELFTLSADFKNTGAINLRAKLISEIYFEGKLIEKSESPEKLVLIGEKEQLVSYLRLEEPGEYLLSSRVLYEGEETGRQESAITLHSPIQTTSAPLGIMLSLSIASLGTAIFFRKEVKKMMRKVVKKKIYYCIDCNRPIQHKGRCFACNKTAKMRKEAQDRKYE